MVIAMNYKNSKDIIFKELGSLQEKVLFYLAQNPDNHKQAIQQGIQHPSDQYGSISKAVDMLERIGFVESKEGISQKKVKIKIYSCTESGVFYTLTHSSDNILEVLDAYKSTVEFCKSFRKLYDVWGKEHFATYLKDVGKFLPVVQKDGADVAMPYLFMLILEEMKKIDPKDRKRNAKEALKLFPESKAMLKEWKKNLDELV
jgi:DNA-binding PadR family transcriptional regulator